MNPFGQLIFQQGRQKHTVEEIIIFQEMVLEQLQSHMHKDETAYTIP